MWDTGTWILLALVVVIVALIVVFSILRVSRRRHENADLQVGNEANPDNTLGDRRDPLRRARGRF